MIDLRKTRDPDYPGSRRALDFYQIDLILRSEFGSEVNFDIDSLKSSWNEHISPKLRKTPRVRQDLPPETLAVLAQGSQGPVQPGSADPQAPRTGSVAPPVGSRSDHHGQYKESQPETQGSSSRGPQLGHAGQYRPPHSSSGDPYESRSGTSRQLAPHTISNQPLGFHPPQFPPIAQSAGGQGILLIQPFGPTRNQNYASIPQGRAPPGTQEPTTRDQTGGIVSKRKAPHDIHCPQPPRVEARSTAELLSPQEQWILSHGNQIDQVTYTGKDFEREHEATWGSRPSGPKSLWKELEKLRSWQARR